MSDDAERDDDCFEGKRVLITGGTGSLGKVLTRRLLSGRYGRPAKVIVFSRDEAKQHEMRLTFRKLFTATEEIIYHDCEQILDFRLGDVRDFASVASVIQEADIIVNAAALMNEEADREINDGRFSAAFKSPA